MFAICPNMYFWNTSSVFTFNNINTLYMRKIPLEIWVKWTHRKIDIDIFLHSYIMLISIKCSLCAKCSDRCQRFHGEWDIVPGVHSILWFQKKLSEWKYLQIAISAKFKLCVHTVEPESGEYMFTVESNSGYLHELECKAHEGRDLVFLGYHHIPKVFQSIWPIVTFR